MSHPSADDRDPTIADKVIAAIAKQKEVPPDTITLDTKFEDLNIDSLDATEILFELEDELDVDIPNEAARAMRDVRMVVDGLQKLVRGEEIVLNEPPAGAAPPAASPIPGAGSARAGQAPPRAAEASEG